MKKLLAILTVLTLIFSLSACGKTVSGTEDGTADRSVTVESRTEQNETEKTSVQKKETVLTSDMFETVEKKETYHNQSCDICEITYEQIKLKDGYENDFEKLSEGLAQVNSHIEKRAKDSLSVLVEYADGDYAENPEKFEVDKVLYTNRTNLSVENADGNAVGILVTDTWSAGGVHPTDSYSAYNISPETGKIMNLSDVVKTGDLAEAVYEKIISKYGENTLNESADVADMCNKAIGGETGDDCPSWLYTPDGVTFYFSPYMIAPYAAGLLTAEITRSEYKDWFLF